ncbi:MAG TPA: 2,3-diaminopropionate biosynthesis protein SbnB [Pyrinomonadaceae bacterium]|nr:2,3-diaminopropionate biosynthesis protein SbnB [Pyrinomonadaceae bacterium]
MAGRDVLTLKGDEVRSLLEGREREVLDAVAGAYRAHGRGDSSLPHSLFLRFPSDERNRIIALPAYLGDGFDVAGVKWVSSFPANTERGLDRASAVIILNSAQTGQPEVIMEGSLVSTKRTAAGAALAALHLAPGPETPEAAGIVGCGPINFEVVRFLLAVWPALRRVRVFDVDGARAEQFRRKCAGLSGGLEVGVVPELKAVLRESQVTAVATTAVTPHIFDLSDCAPGSTVLHISLRDFSPEVILSCDNVVDDVAHVCRAQTSVHLAEQSAGNRDFIRCTLADILNGDAPAKKDPAAVTVFSPFGLGVLDLALARMVLELAAGQGRGTLLEDFLPAPYVER